MLSAGFTVYANVNLTSTNCKFDSAKVLLQLLSGVFFLLLLQIPLLTVYEAVLKTSPSQPTFTHS
ncbi:hypothetical protein D9K80_16210 [Acinetobacter cumulans]|uniref:Uncharacterized protein n=1 Tax=Acinetobacter cumulans TaxID=2136182 RepID=A0A498D0E8_9GAMM|nr:hypothetical protein D9K80_16210 [Acinetobacter cumulans]